MWKIKATFWLHFAFSLVSHILIPMMVVGILKLVLSWELGFWYTGLVLGASLFSLTYLVNHITNEAGFCYLTDLENYYRREYRMEEVGSFLPRFYDTLRVAWQKTRTLYKRS